MINEKEMIDYVDIENAIKTKLKTYESYGIDNAREFKEDANNSLILEKDIMFLLQEEGTGEDYFELSKLLRLIKEDNKKFREFGKQYNIDIKSK